MNENFFFVVESFMWLDKGPFTTFFGTFDGIVEQFSNFKFIQGKAGFN